MQANGSKQQLWVYMSTPLGYGKAEIAPSTVAYYLKVFQPSLPSLHSANCISHTTIIRWRPLAILSPSNETKELGFTFCSLCMQVQGTASAYILFLGV